MDKSDTQVVNALNVAAICPVTKTLGPGTRFVVWVQGCCFSCENCGSPDWREHREAMRLTPAELAARVLATPGIEGLTISGGEPMLQAGGLCEFVRIVRQQREISVICYTGYTIEALQAKMDQAIDNFLVTIDVLIDGPYVDELNDNQGWRGSSNQGIHYLTGLFKEREEEFLHRRRDIEIHLLGKHYLLVGIKPVSLPKELGL